MLLGLALRNVCLAFVDLRYHCRRPLAETELGTTKTRDGTSTAIALMQYSFSFA